MTVYVCFDKDIECGQNPQNWCLTCPKWHPRPVTQQEDRFLRRAVLASSKVVPHPDAERLDWLMHNISGAELRRLGIVTSAGCTRELIDAARGVKGLDHG